MKVAICTPSYSRPHDAYLAALEAAVPALDAAGIEHAAVYEVQNPYISAARATMTRKALDWGADAVVYIDHDVACGPRDLLKLIETDGDVVAGTYRYKNDPAKEEYMGALIERPDGRPQGRPSDGALLAHSVPAGFLKVTRNGIRKIMAAHPELCMGRREAPAVDLFHHGAHEFVWYGEDMAFCRRWRAMGERIWLVPDLDLDHWNFPSKDHPKGQCFPGNYHRFMESYSLQAVRDEPGAITLPCQKCGADKPAPGTTILGQWICDDCYYTPLTAPPGYGNRPIVPREAA